MGTPGAWVTKYLQNPGRIGLRKYGYDTNRGKMVHCELFHLPKIRGLLPLTDTSSHKSVNKNTRFMEYRFFM